MYPLDLLFPWHHVGTLFTLLQAHLPCPHFPLCSCPASSCMWQVPALYEDSYAWSVRWYASPAQQYA